MVMVMVNGTTRRLSHTRDHYITCAPRRIDYVMLVPAASGSSVAELS